MLQPGQRAVTVRVYIPRIHVAEACRATMKCHFHTERRGAAEPSVGNIPCTLSWDKETDTRLSADMPSLHK